MLIVFLGAMALSGCATQVSKDIGRAPAEDFTVAQVRTDVERFIGMPVRWGGIIIDVNNEAEESMIEVIARELRRNGRPSDDDGSPGRFVAVFDGFLDPAVFTEDREITIFGTVEGETVGRIGSREYNYPVVRVRDHHLWPRMDARGYPPGHSVYYYDPFYPFGSYYYGYPRYRSWHPAPPPSRPGILRR